MTVSVENSAGAAFTPVARDASRLYYEAHVTLQPVSAGPGLEQLDRLCLFYDWRRSTFEMHKERVPNAFISARDISYASMLQRVAAVVRALKAQGYCVLRWKIEDTLADSNRGDLLRCGGELVRTSPE